MALTILDELLLTFALLANGHTGQLGLAAFRHDCWVHSDPHLHIKNKKKFCDSIIELNCVHTNREQAMLLMLPCDHVEQHNVEVFHYPPSVK